MDINMPKKDGLQATKEIIKMFNDKAYPIKPNIVAHTAYGDSDLKEQCYKEGFICFL